MTIGRSRGIEIQGQNGPLEIAGNHQRPAPAYLYSITITSQALSRWGRFKWEDNTPGTNTSTSITYHVYYPTGSSFALVPEDVLPGNSVGFSSEAQGSNQGGSKDLSVIPVYAYPSLILGAELVAAVDAANSPKISEWKLEYYRWTTGS